MTPLTFSNVQVINDTPLKPPQFYQSHENSSNDSINSSNSSLSTIKLSLPPLNNVNTTDSLVPPRIPLLRKKSGELVKSSLKLSSLTKCNSSPQLTNVSPNKSVRFASRLINVKMFDGNDSPSTVSTADNTPMGSPKFFHENSDSYFKLNNLPEDDDISDLTSDDDENFKFFNNKYVIKSHNVPSTSNMNHSPIYLQSIFLSSDGKVLQGLIMCQNLAFEKKLSIKLTFNGWKSNLIINNTQYVKSLPVNGFDQFMFNVPLNNLPKSLNIEMVIKYEVNHNVYWDNNRARNYHITLRSEGGNNSKTSKIQNYNYSFQKNLPQFDDLVHKLLNFKNDHDDDITENEDDDFCRPLRKSTLQKRYSFNSELSSTPRSTAPPVRPKLVSSVSTPLPKYSQSYKSKHQDRSTTNPPKSMPGVAAFDSNLSTPDDSNLSTPEDSNLSTPDDTKFNSKSYTDLLQSYCFYNGNSEISASHSLHHSYSSPSIPSFNSTASSFQSLSDSIHI